MRSEEAWLDREMNPITGCATVSTVTSRRRQNGLHRRRAAANLLAGRRPLMR